MKNTNPKKHEAILKTRRLNLNQLLANHFGKKPKIEKMNNNPKTK